MTSLEITLLTIGILEINEEIDEETALREIEFFYEPGEDASINYDPYSLIVSGEMTNDYWHLVPDLERQCDADEDKIWQQIIWEIEGDFEIPQSQNSIIEYLQNSMGCYLWIQSHYNINLIDYHFKIISVNKLG